MSSFQIWCLSMSAVWAGIYNRSRPSVRSSDEWFSFKLSIWLLRQVDFKCKMLFTTMIVDRKRSEMVWNTVAERMHMFKCRQSNRVALFTDHLLKIHVAPGFFCGTKCQMKISMKTGSTSEFTIKNSHKNSTIFLFWCQNKWMSWHKFQKSQFTSVSTIHSDH